MVEIEGSKSKILNISFNQDQGCFAVGTEKGFNIYNSFPLKEQYQRDFDSGIGVVTMLFRSNVLGLVGGGPTPKFPQNKVMLWDDHQMKILGELSFKSIVRSVLLRREKIVVVLDQRIYLYQIADLKLVDTIDTYNNPQGICAITSKEKTILACPDKKKGYIRISDYDKNLNFDVKSHSSALVAMTIAQDGQLIATACEDGKIIKIIRSETGKVIKELRRGIDKADIYSLSIDCTLSYLACTSDKGTVHIYSLHELHKEIGIEQKLASSASSESKEEKKVAKNRTSVFKFLRRLISYFGSEWSFAKFRIADDRSIVAFGPEKENKIIVATYSGKGYVAEFDPIKGGECTKISDFNLHSSK